MHESARLILRASHGAALAVISVLFDIHNMLYIEIDFILVKL